MLLNMVLRFLIFCFLFSVSLQLPARAGQRLCCGRMAPKTNQNSPRASSDSRGIFKERINWDSRNFSSTADTNKKPFNITFTRRCPDSWLRFRESCYFFEKRRMEMSDAESSCYGKGATLFVANTPEEFDVVMKSATLNFWSWTGLVQFSTMTQPRWQSYGGMEPARLKWLVSPYTSASNGRTAASECAAYYNSEVKIASYNYFYPCSLQFGSICERNSTMINSPTSQ